MKNPYLIIIAFSLCGALNAQTALTFDGTDDYVEIVSSAAVAISGDVTVETKVKTSLGQEYFPLVTNFTEDASAFYHGYWLGLDTLGYALWHLGASSASEEAYSIIGTSQLDDGQWHHISGVVSGSIALLYVDGILETTLSVPNLNLLSNDPFYIGADYFDDYHNGDIDDVRVWNRALAVSEINQYKNSCLIGNENGLSAFYDFEFGTGASDVFDMSPNGNNGTMWGMDNTLSWVSGFNCVVTPISENEFEDNSSIYPNPTERAMSIDLTGLKNARISVFNLDGKLIYTSENISTNNYQFDLEGEAGIYFLEIQSQNKLQHFKIIKN